MNVNDNSEALGAMMKNTSGSRQFTTLSPKASAVLSPLPDLWDIYVNAGEGFHSNMAMIALIDGAHHINPDHTDFTVRAIPHLYGTELGTRVHLFENVDLAGALWYSYLQNETVFSADDGTFVPSAATNRLGVDLEAR